MSEEKEEHEPTIFRDTRKDMDETNDIPMPSIDDSITKEMHGGLSEYTAAMSAKEQKSSDASPDDLAEFLKGLEGMKEVPPMGSVYVHNDGKAISIHLDTKANSYGEWITGEGADVCLYRDRETDKVVGAHLPFYMDTIAVDVEDGIKLIASRYDDKLSELRAWLNAEIAAKRKTYIAERTLKKMKDLGLISVEGE